MNGIMARERAKDDIENELVLSNLENIFWIWDGGIILSKVGCGTWF
jgi:hypothetical protein